MRTTSLFLVVAGLAVSLSACGDNVTKKEAERGWRSTRTAMAGAGVATAISVSGSVGPDGASGSVEGTFGCPDGGSIDVVSHGEVTANSADASLSLEFNGCKADRVVTDGSLDYEAHVGTDEVSVSYVGELQWSGRANGSCVVDASARVSKTSIFGSFSGDVCGYDWSDIR